MKTPRTVSRTLHALGAIAVSALIGFALAFAASAPVNTATWTWTAPADFTNGTAIPSSDAITYNLYLGTAGSGSEAATPALTGITADSVTTSGYVAGTTVCGEVTAVVNGMESAHSSEACKSFAPVPKAPAGLTAK